ncbi:two-component sensor histidine kinase [Spirochaetia bacterium]|nr:two-component sensor histidine kinase [Spirochaetia bacterium]
MKKNNGGGMDGGTQLLMLRLAFVYRFFCLIITALVIIIPAAGGVDSIMYHHSFVFLLFLAVGMFMHLLFFNNLPFIFGLIMLDYFAVLLYQYYAPHYIFMEVLWMPQILTAIALIVPAPFSVPFTFLLGVPCSLLLSYGFCYNIAINIGGHEYPYYIASLFYYVPVTVLSTAIGRMSFYTKKLRERTNALENINLKLEKINRQVTDKMFSLQNDTTLEERKRISKEIHDTAGYVFINLIMMLQAASAILYKDIGKAEKLINDARDYAERGINEIRHILRNIRDYMPAEISLQNELFDIGESFRKATDVALTIEFGNWPASFSNELDSFFKSFMQEALTNALKHGHASAITIMCWDNASRVSMRVSDNGEGMNSSIKKGIGISAIEDFLNQHKGTLIIQSDNTGFKITASISLE